MQGEVDGPDGAMKVDRPKQVGADADETDQGGEAPLVDGQPLGREDGVVQQAVQIEGPGAVARHVGVAEHEVHVVDRIQAAEKAPQEAQPPRDLLVVALLGPDDERGDLLGIERFAGLQAAMGIAADPREQAGQVAADDLAAQGFVGQTVIGQVVLIEEVAERSVADVVQQGGQPHQRFHVAEAGHVGADLAGGSGRARPPPGRPGASRPARAGSGCARPWGRPTRRSGAGGSGGAFGSRGGR